MIRHRIATPVLVTTFVLFIYRLQYGILTENFIVPNRPPPVRSSHCNINSKQRNDHRKTYLDSICSKMTKPAWWYRNITNVNIFASFFVDDVHKILYCEIPKVACSNWKRVMIMLTGKVNVSKLEQMSMGAVHGDLQKRHLVRMNRYTPAEIKRRLETYFKFVFVRHPFERMVSAFEDKFATPGFTTYTLPFGRKIIRRFRQNPSRESLTHGHDVTFEEFASFVADEQLGRWRLDNHWRPFTELCLPCLVRWDAIGKYETLSEDANFILDIINNTAANNSMSSIFRFPPGKKHSNRTADVLNRFKGVPANIVEKLSEIYTNDLKLFEYEYSADKHGLTNYITENKRCIHVK